MTEQKEKKNIAVIGNEEFTLGFELAGIQKSYNPENYKQKIQELTNDEEIGILVTKQEDIKELPSNIKNKIQSSVDPVVVQLSEEGESMGLNDKIQKVIGIDLS